MAPQARPENVLKRAEELIAVDQAPAALELLYETISSKRSRNVLQASLEPIMLKFIDLSVELRKSKVVKDGLHQYKKIVQNTNINSIESIIKHFLQLTEDKVASAQAKADKISLDADDDLEAGDSPEGVLLATVSSEQSKDRTDREVVTPWLKFLWEGYRSTLDVLRNNSKLEVLYKEVVQRAFDFCFKYTRKTEFRRLCELLRSHLQTAAAQSKSGAQTQQLNLIDLSDADTLQRYLDTRFDQLNVAVKLELWQEAFRSVEDVHTLLTVSKRPAKVSSMANYYENLARIFIVSGNQLFHAAAWSRYYSLSLQARAVPKQESERIASFYMLSVLAIPPTSASEEASVSGDSLSDEQKHRNSKLSSLLNLSRTPTRDSLLKSALAKNVLAHVRPEIRELYKILEVDFHPLSIKKRISPYIEKINSDPSYNPYIKSLYQVILTRLFQQLSQVYKVVKLDFVIELASLPGLFNASPVEIEKFIVRGCHKGQFAIKIDHVTSCITFRDDIYQKFVSGARAESLSLQATPAEIVQCQLSNLAQTLSKTVAVVDPVYQQERESLRSLAAERARAGLLQENRDILNRQQKIEKRQKNEQIEQSQKEEQESKERALRLQEEQAAEQQRLLEDQKRREQQILRQEQEAVLENEMRQLAEQINSKGIIHIDVENLGDMDTEKLRKMELDKLQKEKLDLNGQNRITGRRLDHLVRAYRLEEIPFWEQDSESQQEHDRKLYETRIQALKIRSKQQYEEAVKLKGRLQRLVPEFKEFRTKIQEKSKERFEIIRKENERLLAEEKEKRIAQHKARKQKEAEERAKEEEGRAERERLEEERKAQEAKEEEKRASQPAAYRPGQLRRTPRAGPSPGAEAPSASPSPANNAPAKPKADPFGAARGKPVTINREQSSASPATGDSSPAPAYRPSPRADPFGAAKGRPASIETTEQPKTTAPAQRKSGSYLPPSRRKQAN